MSQTIQLRRDTSANWTSVNPTLNQGELGVETDTGKGKLGTGAAAWNSLPYWNPDASAADVSSVFGRTGTVTAQSGDYTAAQVGADAAGSAATAQAAAEAYAAGEAAAAQSNAETYAASAASTAQANAETFATGAVAAETTRAEAAEAANAAAITAETARAEAAEALKAPLASPALTGTPTAPTQTGGDNSTRLATTAFVAAALAAASGALTQVGPEAANYTATPNELVLCDISGGSFTVLLPDAPAAGTLFAAGVVAVSGVGVNTLTFATQGSDVLDKSGGGTSGQMTLLHQSVLYEYNSGVWGKVSSADPYLQVAQNRQGTFYLDQYSGTDDQKMTSALAAWSTAGSGKIVLSPRAHTFANQWTTSYSAGVAQGLIIEGAGVAYNGWWGTPSAATTVTFTYSGAGAACMDFQHIGSIELRGIQFKSANVGVPLFQTTNATPNIHDCIFSGGGSASNWATDAIVLGGTGSSYGAGDTAPYQGYQGAICRCFFDGIRRVALFQTSSNSIEIFGNTVSSSCGNAAYLGGCIEFNDTVNNTTGNHIWGNCVEMVHYPCFIRCTSNAKNNTFGPNGLFDAVTTLAMAYYVFFAGCSYNTVRDGYRTDTVPLMLDLSGNVGNEMTTFHQSQYSLYPQPIAYYSGSYAPLFMGAGGGPISMDNRGNGAQLQPYNDVPSANDTGLQLFAFSSTQVTDGIIYNGSAWVVSNTAAFVTTDVYRPMWFTGAAAAIPIIIRIATPSTAIPWAASNAQALGDIVRPTTGNSHLYQCTTAGTTGSSQPTWPTSGGTVTDGTAVWTDLGTSATAALLSGPATATNTGVTVQFGRLQTGVGYTKFDRHHIITSDGATPSTGTDAGAGTGPSGISTTGSDHSFTVNITTGTSPASGQMFHTNMAQSAGTFHHAMTAGNAAAAALMAGGYWIVQGATGTGPQVNFTNAPAASTAYIFNFVGMA